MTYKEFILALMSILKDLEELTKWKEIQPKDKVDALIKELVDLIVMYSDVSEDNIMLGGNTIAGEVWINWATRINEWNDQRYDKLWEYLEVVYNLDKLVHKSPR